MYSLLTHCRVGTTIGLGFFCLGLVAYRSQEREVFGLWSWPFLALIALSWTLLLIATARTLIRSRKPDAAKNVPMRSMFWETGFVLWGLAYFLSALIDPETGAQIIDLNVFGSSIPAAALLLWVAMFLGAAGLADGLVRYGRHSKWSGPIAMLVATIFALVLIEGGTRVRAIIWPHTQGYPTYTTDLWKRKYVSLNRNGFRDVEHAHGAADGVRRLFVVGDSFTFGWGIDGMQDRFGEQLAARLSDRTKAQWEPVNIGKGDTHTLNHIEMLEGMLADLTSPDAIILLYVFNDMDYLSPITVRAGPSEQSRTLADRLSPSRILFKNLFLFQEVCVRLRLWSVDSSFRQTDYRDPYNDDALLDRHLQDLSRFVRLATADKTVVAIVPFEPAITESEDTRRRYERFVGAAADFGLPVWAIDRTVFEGHPFSELVVNKLDRHPSALAYKFLAEWCADRILDKTRPAASFVNEVR